MVVVFFVNFNKYISYERKGMREMKIKYTVEVTIEAENLESADKYMKEHYSNSNYKLEGPVGEDGQVLPDIDQEKKGFRKVFYEPLCPYGHRNCCLDPAIEFAEKTDKSVVTREDYPKDLKCAWDEKQDTNNDCKWYDNH